MKRFALYTLLCSLFLGIPALSYSFLDQIFIRRFEDFSYKWFARETNSFLKGKSLKILQKYESVALASTDLKGFGLFVNGQLIEHFGDVPIFTKIPHFTSDNVLVERIGFLKYRTFMQIPDKQYDVFVFFTLKDDTAVLDFIVLVFSAFAVTSVVLYTGRRREMQKIKTIQETTVLTIRSLAHDFRAPFSKLRNFMNVLERKGESNFGDYSVLQKDIFRSFKHVDDLLADFLNLDTGAPQKEFNACSLLKKIEELYVDSWKKEHQVLFTMQCDKDLWALGNDRKTSRILFNFLDNAFKHAASWVDVEVQVHPSEILFCVSNDGDCIAKEHLNELFKPFCSYRPGGLGLGLFICENFARAQGGRVFCTSADSLTTFTLVLPLANWVQSGVPKLPVCSPIRVQSGVTGILLAYVEDESFYHKMMAESLDASQFAIRTFQNTDEFLLELRSRTYKPDIVVVDRFGPGFDAVRDRFVASCRDYEYIGPIVLYSNSVVDGEMYDGFSRVIDKTRPLSAEDLTPLL